jgi:acyl carrier protein
MSASGAKESISEKLMLWAAAALATAGFFFAITPAHTLVGVPSWLAYALLVSCIGIFIYLSRRIERDERAQVSAVTAGRPALTPEEFGTSYFSAEAAHVATRCRRIFAEFYRFDSSRIHPDDKLYAELRFAAQDALDVDEFLMAIEEEFGVSFSSDEARQFLTMRDITEAIVRKLHNEA